MYNMSSIPKAKYLYRKVLIKQLVRRRKLKFGYCKVLMAGELSALFARTSSRMVIANSAANAFMLIVKKNLKRVIELRRI